MNEVEIFEKKDEVNVDKKNRKTSIYMTKYEKARVLGMRSIQISLNAPVHIDTKGETDSLQIALMELEQKQINMIIRRILPDQSYEDWEVSELII